MVDYNMTGRTYRYFDGDPLYPFGYGLSYSEFVYTSVKLSTNKLVSGNPLTVTIGVQNIGPFVADEVFCFYIFCCNIKLHYIFM